MWFDYVCYRCIVTIRPAPRPVPYIFFIDHDYDHEVVDLDDLHDNDIDTGDAMIALPDNWIDLTIGDVNDGTLIRLSLLTKL